MYRLAIGGALCHVSSKMQQQAEVQQAVAGWQVAAFVLDGLVGPCRVLAHKSRRACGREYKGS